MQKPRDSDLGIASTSMSLQSDISYYHCQIEYRDQFNQASAPNSHCPIDYSYIVYEVTISTTTCVLVAPCVVIGDRWGRY